MLKIKKRSINILIVVSFLFFNCIFTISTKASNNGLSNIIVKPVYENLGKVVNDNPLEFNMMVTNNSDEDNTFISNIEGNDKEFIGLEPENLDLKKGESKGVKVKVNNSDKLPAGAYDYSISYTMKNNDNKGGVASISSNSLRLVFIKEGINLASLNVKDVSKPQQANFHLIYANFNSKEETINTNVSIIYKKDNKEVANYNENIIMQPYPNGFYGTMKVNWDTKDAEMGDYVFKYKATKSDGGVAMQGEKDFAVGEMKGELEGVTAKDTFQGKLEKISAKIKNTGNLALPVTFDISIKNSNGEEVFKDSKQENLDKTEEKTLESQWDTTNVKVGEYTVDYTVKMGNQTQSDTIHFKVLGSYMLHIIIVSIIIILFILFVMLAKRKKRIGDEE